MFLPSDAPSLTYEAYQMEIMLSQCRKPVIFVGLTPASTTYALDMAAAVAGGMQELARRPFVINYVNPVSAFQFNEEAALRLIYAAERNIPTIAVSAGGRGMSLPITRAGALAAGNAGQLAGLVLSQVVREGSPFIRGGGAVGGINMRTLTSSYARPDGLQGWDLAHFYGLPLFGTGGCSDAKLFDAQAAAEAALSLFSNTIAGANLIHDIGYLDFAMTGSLELVAYCDELIGWLKEYLRDLEITEEGLALDLVEKIAPDGNFLETEHTLRHLRDDVWDPGLADRRNYDAWAAAGATTLQQRANHKVWQILETHRPEPLPARALAEIRAVRDRADAEAQAASGMGC
jgi:trimethylamine--corrinoid protein Co-methyltransferase